MAPALRDLQARFRTPGGTVCGAGFLIGTRHVMTCAHVVSEAAGTPDGARPDGEVTVDLPFRRQHGLAARVAAWRPPRPLAEIKLDPVSDIAVLALAEDVGPGLAPRAARLSPPPQGARFTAWGYPQGYDNGVEAEGRLNATDSGGWRHLGDTQALGYFIEPGFSGAPVLDPVDRRLMGMVVAADADSGRRLGFAIPTATLARAWAPLVTPYKELLAFDEEDAPLFFGRKRAVKELEEKLAARPLAFVVGASGTGKSSLIMAGLVPRLKENGDWQVARMRPGRRPLLNLADALASLVAANAPAERMRLAEEWSALFAEEPRRLLDRAEACLGERSSGARLLLVADQLEELFTQQDDPDGGAAFLEALAAVGGQPPRPPPPVTAVAALRADFTGQALQHLPLAEAMRDADVKLGAMSAGELTRAVEEPAAAFGVTFEPGLSAEIVSAMARAPGGLPLMQHALDRLWARQQDGLLTHAGYRAIGGIEGSLTEHAEEVYQALSAEEREAARRVLLRLVRLARPGEQAEDTRRVARSDEIGPGDWPVALHLAEERLVTLGRDPGSGVQTAEVAHEALIRAWPRFDAWLDEDREFGLWRQRLRADVEKWDGRNADALLRGGLLAEAEHWRRTRGDALNESERAFIDAGVERARAEKAERKAAEKERRTLLEERTRILEDTAASQRRALRNLRLALGAVALVVVAAIGLALQQYRSSEREAALATLAEAEAARAGRVARDARAAELATRARALFEGAPGQMSVAGLIALESLKLGGGADAQRLIAEILDLIPNGVRDLPGVRPYTEIQLAPDARTFLAWDHVGWSDPPSAGKALVIDPANGETLAKVSQEGWTDPVLSPDGRWLAVGGFGRRFTLVDLATGETVLDTPRPARSAAVFSPDGGTLWIADLDGRIEERAAPGWGLTGKSRWREGANTRLNGPRLALSLAPDGDTLMIRDRDNLWRGSIETGFAPLPGVEGVLNEALPDPAGRHLVTVLRGQKLQLRDATSGEVRRNLFDDLEIETIDISPDGTLLAAGWDDGFIRVWRLDEHGDPLVLDHDTTRVDAVMFTTDGGKLVAAYQSGIMRVFDAREGELLESWSHEGGRPFPDTRTGSVLIGDKGGTIQRFDLSTGRAGTLAEIDRGHWAPDPVTLHPETGMLVAGIRTSETAQSWTDLQLYDTETAEPLWQFPINGNLREVGFSPDGSFFVTRRYGTGGTDVAVRDTETGGITHQLESVPAHAMYLADGGRRLLVHGHAVHVFDPGSGERLFSLGEPGGVRGMNVTPDGQTILTFGTDGTFRAFDVATMVELWRRSDPVAAGHPILSGDGRRYLAATTEQRHLEVRDVRTGDIVGRTPARDGSTRLALNHTGDRLLQMPYRNVDPETGEQYSLAELWDAEDGETLAELRGIPGFMQGSFGADGHVRLDIVQDRTAVLDARTGLLLWEEEWQPGLPATQPDLHQGGATPIAVAGNGATSLRDPLTGREVARIQREFSSLAFNGEGRRVLGEALLTIALADVDSGEILWTAQVLPEDDGRLLSVHFGRDGRTALVFLAGSSGSVFLKVLDLEDGRVLKTLTGQTDIVEGAILSDPDLVATRDLSGVVRIWRISTGEVVHQIAHGLTATGMAAAAEAPRAVSWEKSVLQLWDLETGERIGEQVTASGSIRHAAITPDGSLLAYSAEAPAAPGTADTPHTIEFRRPGAPAAPIGPLLLEAEPQGFEFDPTGTLFAARLGNTRIRIWDAQSLRPVETLEARPEATFPDAAFGFLNGGAHFAAEELAMTSGAYTRHLNVWETDAGMTKIAVVDEPYRLRPWNAPALAFATAAGARLWPLEPASPEVVSVPDAPFCCRDVTGARGLPYSIGYEEALLVEPESGEVLRFPKSEGSDSISAGAFSDDVSRLYIAERDLRDGVRVPGSVRVLSVPEGAVRAEFRPEATIARILPFDDGASAILLGTPGGAIISGNYRLAWIWRPDEDRLIPIKTGGDPIGTVEVGPAGRFLAIGFADVEVRQDRWHVEGTPRVEIRDLATGKSLRTIPFDRPPGDIEFSTDGSILLVRDSMEAVAFDTATWQELRRIRAHHGVVGGPIALLDDAWILLPDNGGAHVASIFEDRSYFLIRPDDHPAMRIAPDNRTFALGGGGTVSVWRIGDDDTPRPRHLAEFGPFGSNTWILFSGTEGELHVGGGGTLRRLAYETEALEVELCRRIGRGLTSDEIAAHFPDKPPENPCSHEDS